MPPPCCRRRHVTFSPPFSFHVALRAKMPPPAFIIPLASCRAPGREDGGEGEGVRQPRLRPPNVPLFAVPLTRRIRQHEFIMIEVNGVSSPAALLPPTPRPPAARRFVAHGCTTERYGRTYVKITRRRRSAYSNPVSPNALFRLHAREPFRRHRECAYKECVQQVKGDCQRQRAVVRLFFFQIPRMWRS